MRKPYLISLAFILILILVSGCGVPQEEYDELERSALEEIAALESDYADLEQAALEEIETLESDFEIFFAEYEVEIENYEAAIEAMGSDYEGDVTKLTEIVIRMQIEMSIVLELFAPAFTGDDLSNPSSIATVRGYIEELGDANLSSKFDAWASSPDDQDLAAELLEAVLIKLEEDLGELQ